MCFHLNRMENSKDDSSSETTRGSYLDLELSIFNKMFELCPVWEEGVDSWSVEASLVHSPNKLNLKLKRNQSRQISDKTLKILKCYFAILSQMERSKYPSLSRILKG
jgi:hypothetical protein